MTAGSKTRDALLILAVLGLGAVALLPGRETEKRPEADPDASAARAEDAEAVGRKPGASDADVVRRSSPPAPADTAHGLWPLVPGSEWTYRTSGPSKLVPASHWTVRLVEAPEGRRPGLVEAGFGDDREPGQVWLGEDWFFIDALPLTEPLEFLGNRPRRTSGTLLPPAGMLVPRASWDLMLERQVVHTIRDELERPVTRPMRAVQSDRALADGFEDVVVPAGEFGAARVEWTSRLTLFVGRRQVLDALTLEPFRSETTWIAPGVGIVKRQIVWTGSPRNAVTFQLEHYHRPGS
jgi:hypothetical protein